MSNAAFNGCSWGLPTIGAMHASMLRLHEAAKRIKGVVGQSAVAALLSELPQTINNWETRGISAAGAVKAQGVIGCSAGWLVTGSGGMLAGWPFSAALHAAVSILETQDLLHAENVLRAHLRMPLLEKLDLDQSQAPPSETLSNEPYPKGADKAASVGLAVVPSDKPEWEPTFDKPTKQDGKKHGSRGNPKVPRKGDARRR